MVDIILKALLLLSPLVYATNIQLDTFDFRFFHIGAAVLFMASLLDKPRRSLNQFKTPLLLLLALALFSLFTHGFRTINVITFTNLFLACLSTVIIICYLKDPKSCYKYIIWAGAINLVYFLAQKYLKFNPVLDNIVADPLFNQQFGGMLGGSVRLSTYIALIIPFVLNFSWILALIFTIGILLAKEIAILPVLAVILFIKVRKLKYRLMILCAVYASIHFLFDKIAASFSYRYTNVWEPAIKLFFDQPLKGHGLGEFYMKFGTSTFNSYVPFIYGVGVLGLAWIIYALVTCKRTFKPNVEGLALVALLTLGMFEYVVEIPRLWWTITAIISFYAINSMERTVKT